MKSVTINDLSSRVMRLELSGNGNPLGTATGFFVSHKNDLYLVTNWHVLSGRRPFDRQPLDKNSAIPDKVNISYMNNDLNTGGHLEVDLLDDDGIERWIAHPDGAEVDISAIKLASQEIRHAQRLEIETLSRADVVVEVGAMVTIVGYPFGDGAKINEYHALPIWKTGHIASEPGIPFNGKPAILIDATTRSGMSGSPVFMRSDGFYRGSNEIVFDGQTANKFIGIYSGRLTYQTGDDSNLSSELGLVWSPESIYQMLNDS